MLFDSLEQQIQQRDLKIQKLSMQVENLDQQIEDFLRQLKVSPEKLSAFLDNKENFSEETWKELQQQKQTLDEKLNLELANIRNPLKTKKSLSSLNQHQKHWIYVK